MTRINRTGMDPFRKDSVTAGTIAGLVAGTAMALFLMIVSGLGGMGFWHPMELNGAIIYGVDAILGGVGPAFTGLVLHMISCALLGAIFGAILPIDRMPTNSKESGKSTGYGILFGVASWGFVTFFALPLLNQTMKDRIDLAPGWWFLSFLVFGATLGITPVLRRAISHQVENSAYDDSRRAA